MRTIGQEPTYVKTREQPFKWLFHSKTGRPGYA